MEVKIGAEYWEHLEAGLKAFAVALKAFEEADEKLELQGMIVETIGSDAELEYANKMARLLAPAVTFEKREIEKP